MILYVSGPMTGLPEYNYPAFFEAVNELEAMGYTVVNPARGMVEGWTWEDYARRGVQDVCGVEGVALLPGWEASKGAQLEVHVAKALNLVVQPLSHWT